MKLTSLTSSKVFKRSGIILVALAIITFAARIVMKVIDGKGADLYKSHYGISFSPVGILILFVILCLVGVWVLYALYKYEKLEKDLLSKYGKKDENS